MTKKEIDAKIIEFLRKEVSINKEDRDVFQEIYDTIISTLQPNECFLNGSFARKTATSDNSDIDIIVVVPYKGDNFDKRELIKQDVNKIKKLLNKNKDYNEFISEKQENSRKIEFTHANGNIYEIDIVPVFKCGTQYRIGKDNKLTDPKYYIDQSKQMHDYNKNYRRAIKFIKHWRKTHLENDENIKPLKSFLIECLVLEMYKEHKAQGIQDKTIFDIIFEFFSNKVYLEMPDDIATNKPLFDKKINQNAIEKYILGLMVGFEDINADTNISDIIENIHERRADTEEFLFEHGIMMLMDDSHKFDITSKITKISKKRATYKHGDEFYFEPRDDQSKWKVLNDKRVLRDTNKENSIRGKITDIKTENDKEELAYVGTHTVECYKVIGSTCVYKQKVYICL